MRTMRRIGLIVLACILTSLAGLGGLVVWLDPFRGIVTGIGMAVLVIGVYLSVIGPWQRRWGVTDTELDRPMPGNELLRPNAPSTTRAITIDAPPDDVFPWLLQIGYGRGGWYSYDWVDNDGRPSVDRIDPALQRLAVGDRIEMLPGLGPIVREIVTNHHLVAAGETDSWCLMVEPMPEGRTRLISRWRQDWPKNAGMRVWVALADPGAFVMEQRMLRRIRDLAERHSTRGSTGNSPLEGSADRPALQRVALRLEYATIAWNLGEAIFTVGLGIVAGSLALIGFGMDSVVEVFASSVVVWHIRPRHQEDHPERTRMALRLVATAFAALGLVLVIASLHDLTTGREADASPVGIAYLTVTACVMFGLALWKRRVAAKLRSAPLHSEASMTFLDGILSVLTLTGLTVNAVLGWSWADPVAALIVALAAFRESRENLLESRATASIRPVHGRCSVSGSVRGPMDQSREIGQPWTR